MSITDLSPETAAAFLDANSQTFTVLFFDGEFTDQKEVVKNASEALLKSDVLAGKVAVANVDVEKNNDLAMKYSVVSVPIVVCLYKGQLVKRIDNLDPSVLPNVIHEQIQRLGPASTGDTTDPKQRLNDYLKKLINRAPVMIFMKGNPTAPRCGFSKQLVELLAKHHIEYQSFDILQDEDVRQGLKEYSDWPTYPQIYAKGEFVGGLDILKQMEESGELESVLKVQP